MIFFVPVTWLHFCHHFCHHHHRFNCVAHSVTFVSVKKFIMQFYMSSPFYFLLLLFALFSCLFSATLSRCMLPLSIFLPLFFRFLCCSVLSTFFCFSDASILSTLLLQSAFFLVSSLIFFLSPDLFFANLLLYRFLMQYCFLPAALLVSPVAL